MKFPIIFLYVPLCGLGSDRVRLSDGWETLFVAPYCSPLFIGNLFGESGTPNAPFIAPSLHHWIDPL